MAEFDPSYLRHSFIHQFHGAAMALMGRPPTIIRQVFKLWGRQSLSGFLSFFYGGNVSFCQ
jgi:hypothetical protein